MSSARLTTKKEVFMSFDTWCVLYSFLGTVLVVGVYLYYKLDRYNNNFLDLFLFGLMIVLIGSTFYGTFVYGVRIFLGIGVTLFASMVCIIITVFISNALKNPQ